MKNIFLVSLMILVTPISAYSQSVKAIDEIAPFNEGLAAVRKGNQWGFMDTQGNLVIDFRRDLVWNKEADISKKDVEAIRYPIFKDGMCLVQKMEDEIPVYGFIDTKGDLVIDHQFLNVSQFNNGYTTGVVFEKVFRGNNEFNLKIYDFKFHDVLMNTSGEIEEFFDRRYHIQMTKRRYELPSLHAILLLPNLIAVKIKDQGWEVRKL
ncbi:MAG: WG repeat-containing protein [Bacteroidota bacterium]